MVLGHCTWKYGSSVDQRCVVVFLLCGIIGNYSLLTLAIDMKIEGVHTVDGEGWVIMGRTILELC